MSGKSDPSMEFASADWLDFLHKLLVARAAVSVDPTAPRVICEVYRKAPRHLAPSGRLAWTRRLENGRIDFTLEECSDAEADVKLVGDYAVLAPLARLLVRPGDEHVFAARMQAAISSGTLEVVRDRRDPEAPRDFTLHNMLAAVTR
jgi:hypothetical protein